MKLHHDEYNFLKRNQGVKISWLMDRKFCSVQ
jgi:hypothetical protein